jgi:CBS domain-containing protein
MKYVHEVLKQKESSIWAIAPDDSVYNAIAKMADHAVGALLVVDKDPAYPGPSRDERHLVGIISERDYARKVILKNKQSQSIPVNEIMSREVISVTSHVHIDECMRLMQTHHVRHLPVIDQGRIIGVLSSRDLFSAIIADQAQTIDHLEHYIRGEAL